VHVKLSLLAVACWLFLAHLTAKGNAVLAMAGTQDQQSLEPRPAGASFRRKVLGDGLYEVSYGFKNFDNTTMNLSFTIVEAEIEGSRKEFGWKKEEVDAVFQKAKNDAEAAELTKQYFRSKGFRVINKTTVQADVPLLVKRNKPRTNGLALALQHEADEHGYGSDEIVGAATAMIQTAMAYGIPPDIEKGRHIGGMHPPPQALVEGWGDCDTKTAVLGSLLLNWDDLHAVGVSLPRHYLLAIERVARSGDAFVEHNGNQYVLVESAGPAWLPPGTIGEETQQLMDALDGIPIQPFN
jgi:hypothetical protein